MMNPSQPPPSLAAVVFDWAGTLVDFGSRAPMGAFVRLFAGEGVAITIAEARTPMGLPKWDHIRAVADLPRVADAWRQAHGGRPATDADIDRLYEAFTPISAAAAAAHADPIPGAIEVVAALRQHGLAIASTTGYHAPVMEAVLPRAAAAGLDIGRPVCAGEVPLGRPSPLAMYRCFVDLGVWPAWRIVKIDDTVPGLLEGRHAGCWTVAVAASGNACGLSLKEWQKLDDVGRDAQRRRAQARLSPAQADFVIDSVADLLPVLQAIDDRLRVGGRPRPPAAG